MKARIGKFKMVLWNVVGMENVEYMVDKVVVGKFMYKKLTLALIS